MKAHVVTIGILLILSAGCASPEHVQHSQPDPSSYSAPARRTSQFGVGAFGYSHGGGGVYLSPGGGHWIKSKTSDGQIVTLEDRSVWMIDQLDRIETMLWLPITSITVVEADVGYLLINTDDGEKAHATLLSQ